MDTELIESIARDDGELFKSTFEVRFFDLNHSLASTRTSSDDSR